MLSEESGLAKAERPDFQGRQYWASLPIYFLPDHVIPQEMVHLGK